MPEAEPKIEPQVPKTDPEWVMGKSGWVVPNVLPQQIEDEAIRDARIAREKATAEQGGPVAGHDFADEHQERTRGRRR